MPQPGRKVQSALSQAFALEKPTLPRHEQMQLVNCMQAPGWILILDIMEQICEFAETQHLALDPLKYSSDQVARSHAETRGQRLMFERMQTKLALEQGAVIAALRTEDKAEPAEPSDENIEDPTFT